MSVSNCKPLPPISAEDRIRFWASVNKSPGQGPKGQCWEWTGHRTDQGYGEFWVFVSELGRERGLRASRLSYFFEKDEDPYPLLIRHHCDNPPCVNPAHLATGNYKMNARDCSRRTIRPWKRKLLDRIHELEEAARNGIPKRPVKPGSITTDAKDSFYRSMSRHNDWGSELDKE